MLRDVAFCDRDETREPRFRCQQVVERCVETARAVRRRRDDSRSRKFADGDRRENRIACLPAIADARSARRTSATDGASADGALSAATLLLTASAQNAISLVCADGYAGNGKQLNDLRELVRRCSKRRRGLSVEFSPRVRRRCLAPAD